MKIVIDIDDVAYKFVQNTSFVEDESTLFKQTNADRKKTLFLFGILDAIKNGTPLPKGHGKLIDSNILKRHIDKLPCLPDGNFAGNHSALKALINMQPTIIEADEAESEDK